MEEFLYWFLSSFFFSRNPWRNLPRFRAIYDFWFFQYILRVYFHVSYLFYHLLEPKNKSRTFHRTSGGNQRDCISNSFRDFFRDPLGNSSMNPYRIFGVICRGILLNISSEVHPEVHSIVYHQNFFGNFCEVFTAIFKGFVKKCILDFFLVFFGNQFRNSFEITKGILWAVYLDNS